MKNKSSLTVIFILIVLCGVSYYLYKNKTGASTLNKDSSNFKVEDTAGISKIFMADKNGRQVTLERGKICWMVNGKYPAREDAINLLIYTIRTIDIKSPVNKAGKNNVIKFMSSKSVKVEIYNGNEIIKQYYVGHENQENDATFMLLTNLSSGENYDEPFLTHIPGFNGYLSSRYFIDEAEWRSRLIINYIPPQLSSIKIENCAVPDSSFVINLKNTNSFELKTLKEQALVFDEMKMKQYLAYFQNINFEKLLTTVNLRLVDSLKNAIPFLRMSITDTKGETRIFSFLHKHSTIDINRKYDTKYVYDPDRFYMRFDNDKEVALVQFYVFGKMLPNYSYFLPQNTVKK